MTHAQKVELIFTFFSRLAMIAIGFMLFVKYIVEKFDLDAPGASYVHRRSRHKFYDEMFSTNPSTGFPCLPGGIDASGTSWGSSRNS